MAAIRTLLQRNTGPYTCQSNKAESQRFLKDQQQQQKCQEYVESLSEHFLGHLNV